MKHPQSTIDFSKVQRQAPAGIWISLATLLRRYARAISVSVIVLLFRLEWIFYIYIGLGLLAVFILLLFWAYLEYVNTTFYIDPHRHEFVLQKGVVNKQKSILSLDKIIQVNLNQNFWQQVFQVYSVEIETAGSTDTEVSISAVDKYTATALRQFLMQSTDKNIDNENISTTPPPTIYPSIFKIIGYAFTSDYLRSFLVLLGILLSIYSRFKDYSENFQYESAENWDWVLLEYIESLSIYHLLIGLFLASTILNGFRILIRYFGLNIRRDSEAMRIDYGLINKKRTLLHKERIQTFTIATQQIQKRLNIFHLNITQTSSDIQADKKAKVKIIGLDQSQTELLFEQCFNTEMPKFNNNYSANIRTTILPFALYFLLPSIAAATLIFYNQWPIWLITLVVAYLLISIPVLKRYYSTYKMYVNDEFIKVHSEIWKKQSVYLRIQDIQAVSISEPIWLKGKHLAHMHIQTGGGTVRFQYGNTAELTNLRDWLLYRIERHK